MIMQQNLLLHLGLLGANFKSKKPDGGLLLVMLDTRLNDTQLPEAYRKNIHGIIISALTQGKQKNEIRQESRNKLYCSNVML